MSNKNLLLLSVTGAIVEVLVMFDINYFNSEHFLSANDCHLCVCVK